MGYYWVRVCCLRVKSCSYLSLLWVSGMFICLSSVCCICLIVFVGSVVLVYYFNVGTDEILVPDYGWVSLAGVYVFDAFF
jgi:hypothetical protein